MRSLTSNSNTPTSLKNSVVLQKPQHNSYGQQRPHLQYSGNGNNKPSYKQSSESDPLLPKSSARVSGADSGGIGIASAGGIRRRSPAPRTIAAEAAAVVAAVSSTTGGGSSAVSIGGGNSNYGGKNYININNNGDSASRMDHHLLPDEQQQQASQQQQQQQQHLNEAAIATTATVNTNSSSAHTPIAGGNIRHQHHFDDADSFANTTITNTTTTGGGASSLRIRPDGTYQPPTHMMTAAASGNGSKKATYDENINTAGYRYYDSMSSDQQHNSRQPQQQQPQQQQQHNYANSSAVAVGGDGDDGAPPLMEIPEDVYAVRKAALQVLKPLTKTWLVVSVGFALTVLFGMARWTNLLANLPYWFILLPSWISHVGLFWCHIMSAKALSVFIAEANDSRQRPDSRDHLDRTEYLPLLQRSLKFGFKTGCISFGMFLFEILLYLRLIHDNKISLAVAFLPLWVIVVGGMLDGLICKTQHFVRVLCWLLVFTAMVLLVAKIDYGYSGLIRWRYIVAPIVAVLAICSATLIYIIYGHQVGYYRLTESQLTAGNLYSLAALLSIVLVIVLGEVIPLSRPVEIETRLFVVILAPLVVTLLGMGAWVVSRDEYGRLLLYGGQAAVHPRKLRWERKNGWTSVQARGVTSIPMFGEVSFQPLEKNAAPVQESGLEMCACCSCYPYEESVADDDETEYRDSGAESHPYLTPRQPQPHLGGNGGSKPSNITNSLPTYNSPTV